MSTQVTVTLSDDIYRRAEYLAHLTGRDIADVLAETVGLALQPLGSSDTTERPVELLSDAEVVNSSVSWMDPAQDRRMSDLLDKQQRGELAEGEHLELLAVTQAYQDGLLRKAKALREAVQRGLRPSLDP